MGMKRDPLKWTIGREMLRDLGPSFSEALVYDARVYAPRSRARAQAVYYHDLHRHPFLHKLLLRYG